MDDLKKKEIMELERENTRRQSGELALENAMYLKQGKTTYGTNQGQFLHMVLLRLPSSCYRPYLKKLKETFPSGRTHASRLTNVLFNARLRSTGKLKMLYWVTLSFRSSSVRGTLLATHFTLQHAPHVNFGRVLANHKVTIPCSSLTPPPTHTHTHTHLYRNCCLGGKGGGSIRKVHVSKNGVRMCYISVWIHCLRSRRTSNQPLAAQPTTQQPTAMQWQFVDWHEKHAVIEVHLSTKHHHQKVVKWGLFLHHAPHEGARSNN